jgi:cytochrome c biogenesis protein CcmG, thiol:disulfide interchange protein DsbE
MKTRSLLTIAFAVLVVVVATIWIRSLVPPESPSGSLAFLSAAPELPILDRAGKKLDLTKEKGHLLIVHFWATWCPPCVEEIPALSKFWDQYRNRSDIVLYAVSVDKDWKTIDTFSAKSPNQLPIYRDPNAATASRFGTTQYPETYIINKAGRVIYRIQGGVEWNNAEIKQRIEQLLAS